MLRTALLIVLSLILANSGAQAACRTWNADRFNHYQRIAEANESRGNRAANCSLPFDVIFSELSAARASIACGSISDPKIKTGQETNYANIDDNVRDFRATLDYCKSLNKVCYEAKYGVNDSCNSSNTVAVEVTNKCDREVIVHVCIADGTPKGACGNHTLERRGSKVTHYTCRGTLKYTINEVRPQR